MLKSLCLALLLAAATLPALAQAGAAAHPATGHYQYCSLIGQGVPGRNAFLDYGQYLQPITSTSETDAVYSQQVKGAPYTNPELQALDTEVKKLGSATLALNYLASHGWECLAVTALNPAVVIYTLRRPAP